jgi:molybdopterin synthase catalytic subunit
MTRDIRIYQAPLIIPEGPDPDGKAGLAGSSLCFTGMVRDTEGTTRIEGIDYEAFTEMAEHQFHSIADEIEMRWPILSLEIHHVFGWVPAGAGSVWVRITSPHRAEGFEAMQHLLNTMKQRVPIWKKPGPKPV